MALAFVFVAFLVIHLTLTSAQDLQGSVQLYSDDGCSDPIGMLISLLAEVCLETNHATAIAIISLPSCANGSPVLYISDLDRCQNPSFSPLISSDIVGECLFFPTGSGIDSAHFACSVDGTTALTSQATVSLAASSSQPTIPTGFSTSPAVPSQVPTLENISAAATTSSALDTTPAAQSSSDQPADSSSGLSLTNRIALGCGIGFGVPAVVLAYLNWRKRGPEPPPPYELHNFGN